MIKRSLERLFPSAARHYRRLRDARTIDRPPSVVTNGVRIFGENTDSVQYRRTSNEMRAFEIGLQHCPVFVDVGANVGLFTCLARRSGAMTIAIEPSPHNLRLLFKNIRENNLGGIEVFPIAAGLDANVIKLWGSGQGASIVEGWGGIFANYSTEVAVNSLDNILLHRALQKPMFIKIDVEGSELNVIRGARALLETAVIFMIEIGFHENFGGRRNPQYSATFREFKEAGYLCAAVEAKRPVDVQMVEEWERNDGRQFYALNFLFMKPEFAGPFAEFFVSI